MGSANQPLAPAEDSSSIGQVEPPLAPPAWEDDATAWNKVRVVALHRLDQMMSREPSVLRGNKPAAIHDFRVASRRFQQAFDLLCPPEPAHGLLRLRRRIARSRKAVSAVRNYDVLIRLADKRLARKHSPRRETWDAVRDYLVKRRADAHARAAAKLGKSNLIQVYLRLRAEIEPEALSNGNARHPADDLSSLGKGDFRKRLSQEIERIWGDFEKANGRARDSSDAPTIHSLRLAAKNLRYLVEIIHEFETPLSGEALHILRGLQDRLGKWHDLEVEERTLAKIAGRSRFVRDHLSVASDILRLIAQNRKSSSRLLSYPSLVPDPTAHEELKMCVFSLMAPTKKGR
ncbi:MAG: CHAD domain-containing protein [Terriglobia bacterium]